MGKSKELAELGQSVSQTGSETIFGDYSGNTQITVKRDQTQGSNIGVYKPTGSDTIQIGPAITMQTVDPIYAVTQQVGANGELHTFNYSPSYGWNKRMTMDAAGRVTMPYQPSFLVAKNNGNFTGSVDVVFNYTRHNIGGHYSTSTGRFTAPVDGVYAFDANIMTNDVGSSSGHQYWEFRVNGVSLMRSYAYHDTANTHKSYPLSLAVKLNAGDYINCHTDTNITYYAGNEFHTWFSGYLIG